MEATCDENIRPLELVISNVQGTENLPFEVDLKSFEGMYYTQNHVYRVVTFNGQTFQYFYNHLPFIAAALENWHILREKIRQAANIHHIKEEMGDLKTDFSNVHSLFCTCKQLDITDMDSLNDKIRSIQVRQNIFEVWH